MVSAANKLNPTWKSFFVFYLIELTESEHLSKFSRQYELQSEDNGPKVLCVYMFVVLSEFSLLGEFYSWLYEWKQQFSFLLSSNTLCTDFLLPSLTHRQNTIRWFSQRTYLTQSLKIETWQFRTPILDWSKKNKGRTGKKMVIIWEKVNTKLEKYDFWFVGRAFRTRFILD